MLLRRLCFPVYALAIFAALLSVPVGAIEPEPHPGQPLPSGEVPLTPEESVAIWVKAMMQGKVERAMEVVAVPFDLGGLKPCETFAEAKAALQNLVDTKGKRSVPPFKVEKTDKAPELREDLFPAYVTYRLTMDEGVPGDGKDIYIYYVYLNTAKVPKLIGFCTDPEWSPSRNLAD